MHVFTDLETLVDDVLGLFARWAREHTACTSFTLDTLYATQLATHEWVANLKRHARFSTPAPRVVLRVSPEGESLACVIEDNSDGFDFEAQLMKKPCLTEVLPESGMGLHMIKALAGELQYRPTASGQQLAFVVAANHAHCIDIQFS
jgi:anti-sigma regulatory factor (Ser/Thr protein kinase)